MNSEDLSYKILENDFYRVKILPQRGCKIASLVYKQNNFEVFHQPQHPYSNLEEKYPEAKEGDFFIDYDTSGCDDCIPTIDSCTVPFADGLLNDHGDVWFRQFDIIDENEHHLECEVKLTSMPIIFKKDIVLDKDGLLIKYRAKNIGDYKCGFMWSLHDLTVIDDDSYLELPEPFSIINVQNDDKWDFDIRDLSGLERNKTFKFYYNDHLSDGIASIVYPNKNMKYNLCFDLEKTPFLGVWITTGGYKNEVNLAIEPSTSYYDSLERAVNNGTAIMLDKDEEYFWDIKINLDELNK